MLTGAGINTDTFKEYSVRGASCSAALRKECTSVIFYRQQIGQKTLNLRVFTID